MRLSQLDLDQQLKLLFNELIEIECDFPGDLRVARGALGEINVVVIGFDFSLYGGSIGVREAGQLRAAIRIAKKSKFPLVMLLNTGGVRVTEGAKSLAAFRFLYRELLEAKLDGLPVLSLVMRHCYGGGSMLAAISDMVLVNAGSQIAMSGPKLIKALNKDFDHDSVTLDDIQGVLSGVSRAKTSSRFQLIHDYEKAYQLVMYRFLSSRQKLTMSNISFLNELKHRFPDKRLVRSERQHNEKTTHPMINFDEIGGLTNWSGKSTLLVLNNHIDEGMAVYALAADYFADAEAILDLTSAINALSNSVLSIKILIACSSHSPNLSDERLLLSEYLSTLAICLRQKHAKGAHVHVVVLRPTGGGIFAALSAAASEVSMLKTGSIQVLPSSALDLMHWKDDELIGVNQLVTAQVVDNIIDDLSSVMS